MSLRPHGGPLDAERLARYLKVLAVPSRIQLLQKLQIPHAPSELRMPATRRSRLYSEDRPLSLQAVVKHLTVLEGAGLVRSRPTTRDGQSVREYHVNQPRLFSLVDDLRSLALIRPGRATLAEDPLSGEATVPADAGTARIVMPKGAAVVLVSGPLESRAFVLEGTGPWVVGRATTADVCLDYDPFVSGQNTMIEREKQDLFLSDVAGSRNGTMHNWNLLAPGQRVRLGAGDTIGVGRSLLVFRRA